MKTITIAEATTVLAALLNNGYSRTKVKQLLKYRAVQVDGATVSHPEHPLAGGNVLTVSTEKEATSTSLPCPGIDILFEDEDLVVINKPAGLLTIASASEKTRTAFYKISACMAARPQGRDRVFVVHRLDQGASGLLLFAKNEAAQHTLQKIWPQAEKRFVAVVEGTPAAAEGTITSVLCESKNHRVYSAAKNSAEGKPAETRYKVVRSCGDFSLVELTPITARKNQFRVHLADLGHPVVGDKKYGAKSDPIKRLALHASQLVLPHPTTGQALVFTARMPQKFHTLLKSEAPAADAIKGAGPASTPAT